MTVRPVAWLACLLPLVGVNVAYAIGSSLGDIPACIPYLEGCTSISSAGRHAPQSMVFRGMMISAGVFMLVSMVSVSSLTAFLATTLTVASLEHGAIATAGDLNGRQIASVEGSTGALFARGHGASILEVENVEQAVQAVADQRAEAAVYDRPMLQYDLRSTPREGLVISASSYEPQGYGFAVSHENVALESRLDVGLLELAESGVLDRVIDQWLGE